MPGNPVMIAAPWLTVSDAVIIVALLAAAVKVLADMRGWTRSTALVRQENADLRERNATLQSEVDRLDALDREKAQQIAALEARVEELQKRDQKAVLEALHAHEVSVREMWQLTTAANQRLAELMSLHETNAAHRSADAREQHVEAMAVWRDIRDATASTSH